MEDLKTFWEAYELTSFTVLADYVVYRTSISQCDICVDSANALIAELGLNLVAEGTSNNRFIVRCV